MNFDPKRSSGWTEYLSDLLEKKERGGSLTVTERRNVTRIKRSLLRSCRRRETTRTRKRRTQSKILLLAVDKLFEVKLGRKSESEVERILTE